MMVNWKYLLDIILRLNRQYIVFSSSDEKYCFQIGIWEFKAVRLCEITQEVQEEKQS